MRIAINALSVQTGGGLTFLRNLLKRLPSIDPEHEYLVFATDRKWRDLAVEDGSRGRVSPVLCPPRSWVRRSWWEQAMLPRLLQRHDVDVLYAPGNQGPLVSAVPVVLFVQNVYPLQPERAGLPAAIRLKMRMQRLVMRASVARAARVIAVSEYTRRLLVSQFRCDPDRIAVIPHGRPEDGDAQPPVRVSKVPAPGSGRRYFLAVSDIRANKNYETLLEAFALASPALGTDVQLLVAGHIEDRRYFARLRRLAQARGVASKVHFMGGVEPARLRELYAASIALVFPSRVESFGLPPLEAISYGVPVAAADIEPVREVCGTAPLFFNPRDARDLAGALERLAGDEHLRAEMIQRGLARARHFSWERTARRTLELLREAAA